MAESKRPSLWRLRDFRLITAGQTVTQFGTDVSGIAFPLTAVILLHASPIRLGILVAVQNSAFLLIGLPVGVWLDRRTRRPVLITSDLVRAAALAAITTTALGGHLTFGLLLAAAAVMSAMRVVFDVGYQSYLPTVVPTQDLLQGNATVETSRVSGQVMAPGVGGWLVQGAGAANALLLDAASYLASAWCLWRVRAVEDVHAPSRRGGMVTEAHEGVRFVFADPVLRALAATNALSNLLFTAGSALMILFLIDTVGITAGAAGLIFSVGSAAALAGAAVTTRLARLVGSARVIWLSVAVASPLNLLIPLAHNDARLAFFVVGVAIGGAGQLIYSINQVSYRQTVIPSHLLGRMNATMRFLVMGALPLGGLLGGGLGSLIGIRDTLWVIGVGLCIAPLFVVFSPLRSVRDVTDLVPHSMV